MKPSDEEIQLWRKGCLIIGVDEVGRGAFAGPIVAGAVILSWDDYVKSKHLHINDSKKLSQKKREESAQKLHQSGVRFSHCEINVEFINKYGIGVSNSLALKRAIDNLLAKMTIKEKEKIAIFCDYFNLNMPNAKSVVGGDSLYWSIAAASILSKVYRDKLMSDLAEKCSLYGWEKNKGYGTSEHINAIKKSGLSRHHRSAFVSKYT